MIDAHALCLLVMYLDTQLISSYISNQFVKMGTYTFEIVEEFKYLGIFLTKERNH